MRCLASLLFASVLVAVPCCGRTDMNTMVAGTGGAPDLGGMTGTGGAFSTGGVVGTGGSSSTSGGVAGSGGYPGNDGVGGAAGNSVESSGDAGCVTPVAGFACSEASVVCWPNGCCSPTNLICVNGEWVNGPPCLCIF
jgi:hypothetical protein